MEPRATQARQIHSLWRQEFGPLFARLITIEVEKALFYRSQDLALERHALLQQPDLSCYFDLCYDFKVNLDPRSLLNRDKSPEVAEHLGRSLFCFCLLQTFPATLRERLSEMVPYLDPRLVGQKELNPHHNKTYVENIKLRNQQKIQQRYTTRHICTRCGERKTVEKQVQLSAGDEGYALRLQCVNCGHVMFR